MEKKGTSCSKILGICMSLDRKLCKASRRCAKKKPSFCAFREKMKKIVQIRSNVHDSQRVYSALGEVRECSSSEWILCTGLVLSGSVPRNWKSDDTSWTLCPQYSPQPQTLRQISISLTLQCSPSAKRALEKVLLHPPPSQLFTHSPTALRCRLQWFSQGFRLSWKLAGRFFLSGIRISRSSRETKLSSPTITNLQLNQTKIKKSGGTPVLKLQGKLQGHRRLELWRTRTNYILSSKSESTGGAWVVRNWPTFLSSLYFIIRI